MIKELHYLTLNIFKLPLKIWNSHFILKLPQHANKSHLHTLSLTLAIKWGRLDEMRDHKNVERELLGAEVGKIVMLIYLALNLSTLFTTSRDCNLTP